MNEQLNRSIGLKLFIPSLWSFMGKAGEDGWGLSSWGLTLIKHQLYVGRPRTHTLWHVTEDVKLSRCSSLSARGGAGVWGDRDQGSCPLFSETGVQSDRAIRCPALRYPGWALVVKGGIKPNGSCWLTTALEMSLRVTSRQSRGVV